MSPSAESMARVVFALCVSTTLLATGPTYAQTLTDERVWWNFTVQERSATASPWRWWFDAQLRTREGTSELDQWMVRPAVGFDVTRGASVWAGYLFATTTSPSGGSTREHRVWQQHWWTGTVPGGGLQVRTRFEQRGIEGNDRTALRIREMVRFTRPLGRRAGLAVVVWDEAFVHLNNTVRTRRGVDQNRLFAGVGINASRHGRFEVGYLNQVINGGLATDRRHHILLSFLNLTY